MQKHLISQAPTQPNQAFCGNMFEATTLRLVSCSSCCLRLLEVVFSSTVEPSGIHQGNHGCNQSSESMLSRVLCPFCAIIELMVPQPQ